MPHQGCNKQEPASGRCHRRRFEESDSENESGCHRMRGFRGMHRGPHHFGHHGLHGGPRPHHCMFRERHQPGHFGHHGEHGGHHHPGHFGHHEMSPRPDFSCHRGWGGRGPFNHREVSGGPSFQHGRPHRFGRHGPSREEEPRGEDQGCRFASRQRRHSVDVASIEKHQCQHRKH